MIPGVGEIKNPTKAKNGDESRQATIGTHDPQHAPPNWLLVSRDYLRHSWLSLMHPVGKNILCTV